MHKRVSGARLFSVPHTSTRSAGNSSLPDLNPSTRVLKRGQASERPLVPIEVVPELERGSFRARSHHGVSSNGSSCSSFSIMSTTIPKVSRVLRVSTWLCPQPSGIRFCSEIDRPCFLVLAALTARSGARFGAMELRETPPPFQIADRPPAKSANADGVVEDCDFLFDIKSLQEDPVATTRK